MTCWRIEKSKLLKIYLSDIDIASNTTNIERCVPEMKCLFVRSSLSVYMFEIIFRLFVQCFRLHLILTYQSYLSPSIQSGKTFPWKSFCASEFNFFCMGWTSETEKGTNQKNKLNANKVAWKIKIIKHYAACFQNGEKKFYFDQKKPMQST